MPRPEPRLTEPPRPSARHLGVRLRLLIFAAALLLLGGDSPITRPEATRATDTVSPSSTRSPARQSALRLRLSAGSIRAGGCVAATISSASRGDLLASLQVN